MAGSPERSRLLSGLFVASLVVAAVLIAGYAAKRLGLGSIIPDTPARVRLLELKKTSEIFSDYVPVKSANHSSVLFDFVAADGTGQSLPWAADAAVDPFGRYAFAWRIKVPFHASFGARLEGAEDFEITLTGRDGSHRFLKNNSMAVPAESIQIEPGIYVLSASATIPLGSLSVDFMKNASIEPSKPELDEAFKVMSLSLELDEFAERDLKRLVELAKISTGASTVKMPSGRVNARIIDGERALDASIGLSGRTREHLDWAPSLDVSIKGGKAVAGLDSFKLYRLGTKSGLYDMAFLSVLRDMGLFVPREEAVVLIVNGVRQGVYILMETPAAPLFAGQERSDGNILGLDIEKLFFDYPYGAELDANVFYKVQGEEALDARFYLSEDFVERLDRRSTALYAAFASAYYAAHGLGVDDLRFYEDPATGFFTPIPRDLNPGLWSTPAGLRPGLTHLGWLSTPQAYTVWPVKRLLPDGQGLKRGAADDFSSLDADETATGVTDAHFGLLRFMSTAENRALVNGFLRHFRENAALKLKVEARLVNALRAVLAVAPYEGYLAEQLEETARGGVKFLGDWLDANLIVTDSPITTRENGVNYVWNAPNSTFFASGLSPGLTAPVAYGVDKKTLAKNYALAFRLDRRVFSLLNGKIAGYPRKSYAEAPENFSGEVKLERLTASLSPIAGGMQSEASALAPKDVAISLGTLLKDDDRALVLFLVRNATKGAAAYGLSLRGGTGAHEPLLNAVFTLGEGKAEEATMRDVMTNSLHEGELMRLVVFDVPLSDGAVFYSLSAPDDTSLLVPPYMYLPARARRPGAFAVKTLPVGFVAGPDGYHVESGAIVKIEGHVALPRHKKLVIRGGAAFEFAPKASLTIYGDLYVNGTKERPVKFVSAGSGEEAAWGGIFVSGPDSKRVKVDIRNAVFDNMGEYPKTRVGGRALNGAVTIRGADVRIEESVFSNSRGEDALNVISSTALINGLEITGSHADALDFDFVKGTVTRLKSGGNGGDGLDLSGSLVTCYESSFIGNRDKGISVGELSSAYVHGSVFEDNDMGIANKDQSSLVVKGSSFVSNNTAIAEFIKKPYFGRPVSSLSDDNAYAKNGRDYEWRGFFFY